MSNIFSFLIATDCHLGYEETDQVIGDDSFITFEEILIKAVEKDVDIILLGGDLFHHNNPSQKCMNKCMELLRRYTLGDKPVYFELLCNASEVISNPITHTTNYLDENINVSIPVFSIHGNHDDPSGVGHFSALDTLSSAGLVNYFGKWTDLEKVIVKPILLRKGVTKIALYGLSHIKDDRLCRLFIDNKVKFVRPEQDPEEWFNIFVLHQNRVDRGPKRFISESYIPDFMDLVIWGHEHDCAIEPLQNMEKGFYVIQPGSSVPTSLSEGEAIPKFVATLKVHQKKMKVEPLKLYTTRPFLWQTERLWEVNVTTNFSDKKSEEIKEHCVQVVEEMIKESKKLVTGHTKQPLVPLIRLRCDYDDESQLFNMVKFGQLFTGRVANPNGEIIRFKRSTARVKKEKLEDFARLNELYKDNMEEPHNFMACVNHIVADYFTNHEEAKMLILRVPEAAAAVEKFIDKDDITAIDDFVDRRFEKVMKELAAQKVLAEDVDFKELFKQMREEDEKKDVMKEKDLDKKLEAFQKKEESGSGAPQNADEDSDFDIIEDANIKHSQSRPPVISNSDTDEYDADKVESPPPRRGQASRKKNDSFSENSDLDIFEGDRSRMASDGRRNKDEETPKRGRGRGRGRGGGRGRAKAVETSKRQSPRKSAKDTSRGGKSREPLTFTSSVVFDDDSD